MSVQETIEQACWCGQLPWLSRAPDVVCGGIIACEDMALVQRSFAAWHVLQVHSGGVSNTLSRLALLLSCM
jgi:hypothetical protein